MLSMHTPLTRRQTLALAASVVLARAASPNGSRLRIGVMDGIEGLASDASSVQTAAQLGLAGVQVTIGAPDGSGNLRLLDPKLQSAFVEAARRHNIALPNTYLDQLHRDCLKNNAETALHWIEQGIKITRALGAQTLMLVFFGKCAVEQPGERDAVIEPLRRAARMAEEAGVILGFENTISAPNNIAVLDKVNSPALKIWYDIGNSTNTGHFDVPAEIRQAGKERICAFHIKDKTYLDAGAVQVKEALKAIRDIGFNGWAMLETSAPTKDLLSDLRQNYQILQRDMAEVGLSA